MKFFMRTVATLQEVTSIPAGRASLRTVYVGEEPVLIVTKTDSQIGFEQYFIGGTRAAKKALQTRLSEEMRWLCALPQ